MRDCFVKSHYLSQPLLAGMRWSPEFQPKIGAKGVALLCPVQHQEEHERGASVLTMI